MRSRLHEVTQKPLPSQDFGNVCEGCMLSRVLNRLKFRRLSARAAKLRDAALGPQIFPTSWVDAASYQQQFYFNISRE